MSRRKSPRFVRGLLVCTGATRSATNKRQAVSTTKQTTPTIASTNHQERVLRRITPHLLINAAVPGALHQVPICDTSMLHWEEVVVTSRSGRLWVWTHHVKSTTAVRVQAPGESHNQQGDAHQLRTRSPGPQACQRHQTLGEQEWRSSSRSSAPSFRCSPV